MEDNEEYEASRLKKLLEDRIIQAEKENMAILQGSSKPQKDFEHPAKRNVKSCPHVKSPPVATQEWSRVNTSDTHSNIHFLKDLESSLLSTFDNRRNLMDSAKNRYFPCAIPLSPPIRQKRDISEEIHTIDNQNDIPQLQKSENMHRKSPKVSTVIEKCFPPTPVCDKKLSSSTSFERKELLEAKNSYRETAFVHKDKTSPSVRSLSSSFLSNKKVSFSSVEEDSPKSKPVENFSQAIDEDKHGLHFQISLDSCSAKDVISKMLHKIPDFVNNVAVSSNNSAANSNSSSLQREKHEKITQTYIPDSPNNMYNFRENSVKQYPTVSSSVQTEKNKDELLINKHELHHLVKDIVLETLQNIKLHDPIPVAEKYPFTCQKVDSGIQSEIENDVADFSKNFKVNLPDKGVLLDQGNNVSVKENLNSSKGVQVDLYSVQTVKSPDVHDKSCNTEDPVYLQKTDEENTIPVSLQTENGDSIFERNPSPLLENSRIQLMLEKIYDHVCEGKETSKNFDNISPIYPILTRDVAVQFNPLHTSTKSTLTSEIKKTDSSCQYDGQLRFILDQISTADASVQVLNVTEPDCNHLSHVNAYTQYEAKTFLDSVAQTELLLNSEHSATNTSVSSTPVSDSMFMDDLLSEGEISLPWNLRLLSLSGGGLSMNNADSSDTSIKEKDYSLSEGEIHPNVIHYLNMHHSNISEENDLQQDLYPTKLVANSNIQYIASSSNAEKAPEQDIIHYKNHHTNISNSSLSEGEINSNASLSLGEVSPGFRVSFTDSPFKSENPSSKSSLFGCNMHCDSLTAASSSDTCDLSRQSVASSFTDCGPHKDYIHEEKDLQNPQTVLQTVDEEVSTTSD